MRSIDDYYFAGFDIGNSIDSKSGRSNGNSSGYQLFSYRVQVGHNFNPYKSFQNYVSIEFKQIFHNELLYNDYYKSIELGEIGNNIYYKYDEIKFKREKMTINLNYGFYAHFNKSRSFGINPSIGLGVKFVKVSYSDPVNLEEDSYNLKLFNFGSRYRIEGKETGLNINFQIKFFYKF